MARAAFPICAHARQQIELSRGSVRVRFRTCCRHAKERAFRPAHATPRHSDTGSDFLHWDGGRRHQGHRFGSPVIVKLLRELSASQPTHQYVPCSIV